MTARRIAAIVLFAITAGFLWVALLTPLRSAEVAALDAEAQRLGEAWVEATEEDLLSTSPEVEQLLLESNESFAEARALEAPMAPLAALGSGLIAAAAGIALWPSRPRATVSATDDA